MVKRYELSDTQWRRIEHLLPGKPGDPGAPPPMTADEQRRFDAGRAIFEAMCQACHQADGRGEPGRAASLVGSPVALAADGSLWTASTAPADNIRERGDFVTNPHE